MEVLEPPPWRQKKAGASPDTPRWCFPRARKVQSGSLTMTAEAIPVSADGAKRAATYLWWQRGIIYQVYPRSFMDSNGDGVGDLRGLISRLDYLRGLGVDAVWLSPIFPSPMKDFGYDVSDYTGIHPLFGTL